MDVFDGSIHSSGYSKPYLTSDIHPIVFLLIGLYLSEFRPSMMCLKVSSSLSCGRLRPTWFFGLTDSHSPPLRLLSSLLLYFNMILTQTTGLFVFDKVYENVQSKWRRLSFLLSTLPFDSFPLFFPSPPLYVSLTLLKNLVWKRRPSNDTDVVGFKPYS